MPSILLINDNKIVSRLLQLSSQKHSYSLEEVTTLDTLGDSYDVIFIDSDKYSNELHEQIKSKLNFDQLGYIGTKQGSAPEGFDLVIEKPFLPTDFVDLIKKQVVEKKAQATLDVDENLDIEIDDLDFDDEKELLLDENLEIDDKLQEESDEILLDDLDALDDLDLSLESSAIMSTGIAASMMQPENNHQELAGMVSEIDEMSEESVLDDEISKELLREEDILDEIDTPKIEESIETQLDEDIGSIDDIDEEIEKDLDQVIDDEQILDKEPVDTDALAIGVGAVALGAMASQVLDDNKLEDTQKGVSTMTDIEDLNEADLKSVLDEGEGDVVEEIISQEIVSEGEETVVESNDIQQWIKDAVAKAITPEMIKEALDGMDVNVTLSFNSKKV